jgi:hypothetical protein
MFPQKARKTFRLNQSHSKPFLAMNSPYVEKFVSNRGLKEEVFVKSEIDVFLECKNLGMKKIETFWKDC